ncbi:MAG: hypothetical protein ABJP66_19395, partial [Hyphomicrobiales bacterium]
NFTFDALPTDAERGVIVCANPFDDAAGILREELDVADIIAQALLSDICTLVSNVSEENASRSYDNRRRISVSEIELRIFELLEAQDPSAIDDAFRSGIIEPVDFHTPIDEPGFYQGVKTKAGHISAGLAFARDAETEALVAAMAERRCAIISGPSGAGKSALLWLTAYALAGRYRWYQITSLANANDTDRIKSFIRARRPTARAPIAIAFDDLSSANSGLWNVLVQEFRGTAGVCLLGAIRNEDRRLIANQSDTAFSEIGLGESLAEGIWTKLTEEGKTHWAHWREPFELSEGLLLEYVHLLTRGRRLEAVIAEQVALRQNEGRVDELAIIRASSVLCAKQGEVEAATLMKGLGLEPAAASLALGRLIDEHLVREARPGVLGGLHALRSEALARASHDGVLFIAEASLWHAFAALTDQTKPHVIRAIFSDPDIQVSDALSHMADMLAENNGADGWASILTGLGLATIDLAADQLVAALKEAGVPRAFWSLAAMFTVAETDLDAFKGTEGLKTLSAAIAAFRKTHKDDLRAKCLDLLPESVSVPKCSGVEQTNRFFASLLPIAGGAPPPLDLDVDFPTPEDEADIKLLAPMLHTAYEVRPDLAQKTVEKLGGEQRLLDWFLHQRPWVTTPQIMPDGENGRTVRADLIFVSDDELGNMNDAMVEVCETLIALSPASDAAACEIVSPMGKPLEMGGYRMWSKDMPRQNLPAKSRVAWNVAFRQLFQTRAAPISLTDYAEQMSGLVRQTEKLFRSFSEKWIKGKRITNAENLAEQVNHVVRQVNQLAYASTAAPGSYMTGPGQSADVGDQLGSLIAGVLENLIRRMGQVSADERPKTLATFAGGLADQAHKQAGSNIWRMIRKPPLQELQSLEQRLQDVCFILHEMAYDQSDQAIRALIAPAKKAAMNNAVRTVARSCSSQAESRFRDRLKNLEQALLDRGWSAKCWVRSERERDSIYWPAAEVAILIEVDDLELHAAYLDDGFSLAAEQLNSDWKYRVVPIINGVVASDLAMTPSTATPLPDISFGEKWANVIPCPFLVSTLSKAFEAAYAACVRISALINSRDFTALHPDEDEVFSAEIRSFEANRSVLAAAAEASGDSYVSEAWDILGQLWNEVIGEYELVKDGGRVENPVCEDPFSAFAGDTSERVSLVGVVKMLLQQTECRMMEVK